MYTASSIFLKTLADAGLTHAFVNWGSDHPGILEDLQRQRGENGGTELQIITCPNEMVALSAAQGYGQVAGKPAAVIVHVDVGTQALAGAVHNANCSRTPILIYAGASPFSFGGEHKGGRNEFIMWLQDIPDQSQIVRQYMRYTGEFYSAATIPRVVHRGLQFATSEPKGPIYLWARREIMEQEVEQSLFENIDTSLAQSPSVEPSALTPDVARRIALALLHAENPLIITSRLGRNRHAIPPLVNLSKLLSIPIISTIAQTLNCPFSHQYNLGVTYLYRGSHTSHLASADVILVIDCDLPWIPNNEAPSSSARVFIIDGGDPLYEKVGYSNFPAEAICRADAQASLTQLALVVEEADSQAQSMGKAAVIGSKSIRDRGHRLAQEYESQIKAWDALEGTYPRIVTNAVESSLDVPNLLGTVRKAIQNLTPSKGRKTLILNEAITNYPIVWGHIRPEIPGSYFTAGGGSLGWGLGAAVGAHLSSAANKLEYELSVLIVGDGCFMFGVPTTAFWMARKYQTPFLTIILNNGGWRAPKASLLGVHPTGYGSAASIHDLTTGFGPHFPEYSEIAVAASSGWAWGRKVGVGEFAGLDSLEKSIEEAIKVVLEEKRCAVLDYVKLRSQTTIGISHMSTSKSVRSFSEVHYVELDSVRDSKITNVNLYTSLAEIRRFFKFGVKDGFNQVTITGLPSTLDQNSLRVEGISTSIHDVVTSDVSPSPENIVSDTVKELLKNKEETGKAILRCKLEAKYLENYFSTLNVKDVAIVDLSGILKNYRATAAELDGRIDGLIHDLDIIDSKLADEKKKGPVCQADSKGSVKITVGILAESEGDAEFNIVYGVSKAHWNAFYDIRVNTRDEQKPVELAYKASISQNTGEEWKDVDLTLETAEPTFGSKIPRLHPWIVYRPTSEEDSILKGSTFGSSFGGFSSLGGSVSKTRKQGSRAPHTEAEKMQHGEEHHANIIATFTIEGKMHIPCDGATHSVSMMSLNLDSKTYWVAVPKREARAHVRAKIKNASEYPLLGGPAHVYVDGSFIASMELPVVCPGEYFDCPLGHDPSIHSTYHPRTKKTSRTGFYSKSTTQTFTQRITITNMKTSAIEGLRVSDQFPLSEDPHVSVKYISPGLRSEPTETTSGEIKVLDKVKGTAGSICAQWSGADEPDVNAETFGKDGKFDWICAIPSQGKIELQLQFEVTAPHHSQIVGL